MTNKTKTETPEKSQIDRFKEAARELETDDDEARFKERFRKLTEARAAGIGREAEGKAQEGLGPSRLPSPKLWLNRLSLWQRHPKASRKLEFRLLP